MLFSRFYFGSHPAHHRRIWIPNALHTYFLPKTLDYKYGYSTVSPWYFFLRKCTKNTRADSEIFQEKKHLLLRESVSMVAQY